MRLQVFQLGNYNFIHTLSTYYLGKKKHNNEDITNIIVSLLATAVTPVCSGRFRGASGL